MIRKIFSYRTILELAGLAVLVLVVTRSCSTIKALEKRVSEEKNNTSAALQTPSEKTAVFTVTHDDFPKLFPAEAHQLDSLKASRRVKSYHTIQWKHSIDTVLVPYYVERENVKVPGVNRENFFYSDVDGELLEDYTEYTFDKDCVHATFKRDSVGSLHMKLDVTPSVDIVLDIIRPKLWLLKGKWNPAKWPEKTTSTNPCGWEVTKNIKINFKKK